MVQLFVQINISYDDNSVKGSVPKFYRFVYFVIFHELFPVCAFPSHALTLNFSRLVLIYELLLLPFTSLHIKFIKLMSVFIHFKLQNCTYLKNCVIPVVMNHVFIFFLTIFEFPLLIMLIVNPYLQSYLHLHQVLTVD